MQFHVPRYILTLFVPTYVRCVAYDDDGWGLDWGLILGMQCRYIGAFEMCLRLMLKLSNVYREWRISRKDEFVEIVTIRAF